jgi:hypothetical protein
MYYILLFLQNNNLIFIGFAKSVFYLAKTVQNKQMSYF